jgi:hypothetical protein
MPGQGRWIPIMKLFLYLERDNVIGLTQIIQGSDAIWGITEALADGYVRPDLRGLRDLGGLNLSPRLHHYHHLKSIGTRN